MDRRPVGHNDGCRPKAEVRTTDREPVGSGSGDRPTDTESVGASCANAWLKRMGNKARM
jgi:hypothetical protein